MTNRFFARSTFVSLLIGLLCVACLADTIRLKDGTTIRGDVVGFGDQQFTVLIGSGSRGRRSRITLYMEDVEAIEFDGANANPAVSSSVDDSNSTTANTTTASTPSPRVERPVARPTPSPSPSSRTPTTQPAAQTDPSFFQINLRVRGDSTTNGWTNSGLVVRRNQRVRISATGRVTLGAGRFATPAGLPTLPDRDKLMRNEPTGALIAVIGDDNDDFILVGNRREFVAQRDGVLFLGVNEGNLSDNAGAYDAVIEAETTSSARR